MSAWNRDAHEVSSPARPPDGAPPGKAAPGSGQPQLATLQNQVITAVRGAISGVMADQAPATDMLELDLDFSISGPVPGNRLPALRAEADRALTAPRPVPSKRARRWPLLAAATVIASGAVVAGGLAAGWYGVSPVPDQRVPEIVQVPKGRPAVAASIDATASATPKPAPVAPSPPSAPPPARDLLDLARDLVQAGHIAQARAVLLAANTADQPAAALLLARSYDPNFLATLPGADAGPDIVQARQWYTRWYEIASSQGAVPQTMRLDLLLRSLENGASRQ